MADLFKDIIYSVLVTKKHVLENESDYIPYVINKSLSFHYDCILYANQMNMHNKIDKKMQYDYYLNTVRGYKRPFRKWLKPEKIENLELIKEYYSCSNEKAKDILSILSDDQLIIIKKQLDKGGSNVGNQFINRGEAT
jgi:hypothetical protein